MLRVGAQKLVQRRRIAAYLNFDMVGRMQDNKLTVQAAGTSPAWARIIEQANVTAGFDLAVQECSRVLKIRGRVLPSTLEQIRLWAEREDGEAV